MAVEHNRLHDETVRQGASLGFELPTRVLNGHPWNTIAAAVLFVPFIGVKPANEIDADLGPQWNHVLPKELIMEGSE